MAGTVLHRLRTLVKPLVPRRYHAYATRAVGQIVALALTGDEVMCPCCGANLRRFVAYPSLYCPRCGSYERHRLLALQVRDQPQLFGPPLRLLQVSPDRPLERLFVRHDVERVSIDLDNSGVDVAMDVQNLAFPAESFDAVLALHVLDAVADQSRALAELYRVLRPGGRAILQVPIHQQIRLAQSLDAAGFETEIMRATDLGSGVIVRHGLIAEEATHICRKASRADSSHHPARPLERRA